MAFLFTGKGIPSFPPNANEYFTGSFQLGVSPNNNSERKAKPLMVAGPIPLCPNSSSKSFGGLR